MLTLIKDSHASYTKRQLWDALAPGGTWNAINWKIEPDRSVLPPGMTATSEDLSGTPTTAGDYNVTLTELNSFGEVKKRNVISITVPGGGPPGPGTSTPLAKRLAAFLGAPNDPDIIALATIHLPIVQTFVKSYTRERGFWADLPNEDLTTVIITAGARLVVNPEQATRIQIGDTSETPAVFNGFTLAELAVLNRYRRRSA